jgi:hypothetical protein
MSPYDSASMPSLPKLHVDSDEGACQRDGSASMMMKCPELFLDIFTCDVIDAGTISVKSDFV